jgi:hypothetical protein
MDPHPPALVPDQCLFSLERLHLYLNDPLLDLNYLNLSLNDKAVASARFPTSQRTFASATSITSSPSAEPVHVAGTAELRRTEHEGFVPLPGRQYCPFAPTR